MTINEIKNLTKFLADEDVDKIKEEIKSKETILKNNNMEEEEMTQVLNTLFAILVIEKTLESEIEGVEEIRAELEQELLESYEIYDSHMARYRKEEKKNKKSWLLNFLFLSDRVNVQKKGVSASNKAISNLKNELNQLKQQKSNENLKEVAKGRKGPKFDEFCKTPHDCNNPFHDHDKILEGRREQKRHERLERDIRDGRKTENFPRPNHNIERVVVSVKTEDVVPKLNSGNERYSPQDRPTIEREQSVNERNNTRR